MRDSVNKGKAGMKGTAFGIGKAVMKWLKWVLHVCRCLKNAAGTQLVQRGHRLERLKTNTKRKGGEKLIIDTILIVFKSLKTGIARNISRWFAKNSAKSSLVQNRADYISALGQMVKQRRVFVNSMRHLLGLKRLCKWQKSKLSIMTIVFVL